MEFNMSNIIQNPFFTYLPIAEAAVKAKACCMWLSIIFSPKTNHAWCDKEFRIHFHSTAFLKYTRHATAHCHIILTPDQPVQALLRS